MKRIGIAAAIFAAFSLSGMAVAQNGALLPAEMPPAGYTGTQYSDSRGCLFIRASFDGRVTWVPRFDENRRPICTTPAAAQPAPPPAAQPVTQQATPVSSPVQVAAEPAIAPQRITQTYAPAHTAPTAPRRAAATPRRAATPARPRLPAGHHAACPASSPFGELVRRPSGTVAVRCVISANLMLRPVGATPPPTTVTPVPAPRPTTPSLHAGTFVQIATFAVPQNAARTRHALMAQGLMAQAHPIRTRGQHMQVVLAGPYFDASSAQNALQTARRMGFSDAFIRR